MHKNLCFGQGFSRYMHKKYFYTAFIVIVVITTSSYILIRANKHTSPAELTDVADVTISSIQTNSTTTSTLSKPIPTQGAQTKQTKTLVTTNAENAPATAEAPTPNVTLIVGGKSYSAFAPTDSTALDIMRTLASTSDFTFAGRDYPSLGFFVDSINGKKAENGHSWILYVNGKLSGTGASQTILDAGNTLEWRYEKNY